MVTARRFRPQRFVEVLGQEPTVRALKNAISNERLAQAYLFSGERGTGKTTLARLVAKALNCPHLNQDVEPCGQCSSCREIGFGTSMEVIELDAASHRGIEDVRSITEGISYGSSPSTYKVYILDEVHMLTKEAFNALLKTLEEPPARSLFIFATTEPHKVPATILSRCQRFQLKRIPKELIVKKLYRVLEEEKIPFQQKAIERIADQAEGGMRDAESLLDQAIAFSEGMINEETIELLLGLMPEKIFSDLDQAVESGDFSFPFEVSEQLFREGKHVIHFVEGLIDHFRRIVKSHLDPLKGELSSRPLSSVYTKEQAIHLFADLVKRLDLFKNSHHPRLLLEETLLSIIRSRYTVPIDSLVKRLESLEGSPSHLETTPIRPQIQEKELPPPLPFQGALEDKKSLSKGLNPPVDVPEREAAIFLNQREEGLLQFVAVELEGKIIRNH